MGTTSRLVIILLLQCLVCLGPIPWVTGLTNSLHNGVKTTSAAAANRQVPLPVVASEGPVEPSAPSSAAAKAVPATTATTVATTTTIGDKESEAVLKAALAKGEEMFLKDKSCRLEVSRPSLLDQLDALNITTTTTPTTVGGRIKVAPPLTFQKYITMQGKRVVVTFRYTDVPYLKPYFLTVAALLKKRHSDIILEKKKLPLVDSNAHPIFEVLVDGKIVFGSQGSTRQERILAGKVDVDKTQSVFISMEQLSAAIAKARKKRRPVNGYGGNAAAEGQYTKQQQYHLKYQQEAFHQGTKRTYYPAKPKPTSSSSNMGQDAQS